MKLKTDFEYLYNNKIYHLINFLFKRKKSDNIIFFTFLDQ